MTVMEASGDAAGSFEVLQKLLAIRRGGLQADAQALAGAIEQLAAGLALQFGDGGAGGRLREVEQTRSTGYAFLLGDGDEDLQLTESKSHIDITDNPYLNNPVNRYCRRH